MDIDQLNEIAIRMTAPGKGLLAADESTRTIGKRFDGIGLENTEDNRRNWREMLFRTTPAMTDHVSGVILFDETLRQKAADGTPLVKLIEDAGAPKALMVCASVWPSIMIWARASPNGAPSSTSMARMSPRNTPWM